MKLILVDSDDAVLDDTEFTREEWDRAQASALAGSALLSGLHAGDEAR
jgi:hypothetical protein